MSGMTISVDELEDILAAVAGDAPVTRPKSEEPASEAAPEPADSPEEVAESAVDAADVEALIDAIDDEGLKAPDEHTVAEILAAQEPELTAAEAADIASGAVMADPDTEDKAAEIVKEAVAAKEEPLPKVETRAEPAPEPESEIAHTGEKKVVGVTYFIDPERLQRDVSISLTDLDGALMTHASNFVHYAVQAANARRQFERFKAAFEILESRLDSKWRAVLKEENPKTTEAQIRASVVGDVEWKSANVRMIEARTIYELAQDAKEAFVMRRDTLLQLAKDAREERLGQLRVQAEAGARGRVDEMLRSASA